MKRAILFVTFAALCGAQTTVNGGRDYKGTLKASGSVSVVDFSGAGGTAPAKAGTSASRPTACTQGQIYFSTDVAAGQNLYFCTVTGAPGVWTQMSGNAATAVTAGAGAPSGNCTPPVVYIDTTNQDLWYCGAANSWRRPTVDTSGLPTLAGVNTFTGYSNLSGGQWRPPESTVANLPSAAGNAGKVFMVTDAATAGSCSTGGGSLRELCRTNGASYECVGGCGSTGGGGGSGGSVFSGSTATNPSFSATPTFSLADVSVKSATRIEPGPLTGNVTSVTFTNKTAGAKFSIAWLQDGTGGRTVAYGGSATGACTIDPTLNVMTTQFFEVGADGATVNSVGCITNQPGSNVGGSEMAVPGTPAASTANCWFDSTAHAGWQCKANNSSTIFNMVVADTGASNNFLTAINAAGVISKARPTCSSLSDSASGCSTAAYTLPTKNRTVEVIGYEAGSENGSVLATADLTGHAITVNDANAKTLVEASCISDAGDQTVTVKIGATTLFSIHCVAPGSYSASTTNGTTGYIIAASMGSTAVGAHAQLDLSGTANSTTKDVKLHAYGTVN